MSLGRHAPKNGLRSFYVHASVQAGDEISYGSLVDRPEYARNNDGERGDGAQEIHLIDHACYGDYDNSCQVERSNYRVLLADEEIAPLLVRIYGGHGSTGLGFLGPVDDAPRVIQETLAALESYPCLDESDLSETESEAENLAWADGGLYDFRKALGPWLDEQDPRYEHDTDRLSDDTLWRLWLDGCEAWRGGESCHHEQGGGVYFDVKRWLAYNDYTPNTLAQLYARSYYDGPRDIAERARTYLVPDMEDQDTTTIIECMLAMFVRCVVTPAIEGVPL